MFVSVLKHLGGQMRAWWSSQPEQGEALSTGRRLQEEFVIVRTFLLHMGFQSFNGQIFGARSKWHACISLHVSIHTIYRSIHVAMFPAVLQCHLQAWHINNYFNSLMWTNTFKVSFTDAWGTLDMTEHDTWSPSGLRAPGDLTVRSWKQCLAKSAQTSWQDRR